MKRIGFLTIGFALAGLTACSSAPKPATENVDIATEAKKDSLAAPIERYSYALGMDVGKTLKSILVEIDMNSFNLAMTHQMDSLPSLMTEEEAENALEALLLQVQEKREQQSRDEALKEKETQAEFLNKNKLDSTVIIMPSGLQYKILKNGEGISPKRTDKVKVHYVGSLLNGTEFDNSLKRKEPLEFEVGNVIEGWQELLTLMKPGMKVRAWIPSELGYGEQGAEPIIPRNSLLIFEVELLEVFAEPAPEQNMTPTDSSAKPEAKPAPKAEVKPAVKTEAKPEAKPAAKAEVKPAAKTEVKAEAKPAAKAEVKPAAAPAEKK